MKLSKNIENIKIKDQDQQILLNTYRRQNLILNDRISHISNKVLSDKDKIIENLKDEIKKLDTELKAYKTKGWFYY
tara:strand:+ start:289 stop:516 length:228 start_codon:yes stop_codon:yes gene_type:complete